MVGEGPVTPGTTNHALPAPRRIPALHVLRIAAPGKGRAGNDNRAEADDLSQRYDNPAEASGKSPDVGTIPSRIVTVRRRGKRFADVPDMTPEEHQRRGDAAQALWRELVRRARGE